MHSLITNVGGRMLAASAARFTNCLRGYFTFELGPVPGPPFGLLGQPVSLTLRNDRHPPVSILGVTRSCQDLLAGHSLAGLTDVAPRSHRFETSAPDKILAAVVKDYPAPPAVECAATGGAKRPTEQHDQTDFAFLCQAAPEALVYDTGEKLRVVPRADHDHVVTAADLPDGPGRWEADVSHLALSAAAHGLDPGERLRAEVKDLEGLAAHAELNLFLEDVKRFRGRIPAARFLTTGRSKEGLRRRLMAAFKRQLAGAIGYRFRTTNAAIGVGTRVAGLTEGPLVVAATEGHFLDGEFLQEVTAVPEPLAPHWGHEPPPPADPLVLATVADGADPLALGRVPVVFADQPDHVVWARGAAMHAGKDFQVASQFTPGEEVVVGFLHASPGAPVVLGSVFHSKNAPAKTTAKEILLRCGRLTLRLSDLGFDVLIGDSRVAVTADGITFNGKAITSRTQAHTWELK